MTCALSSPYWKQWGENRREGGESREDGLQMPGTLLGITMKIVHACYIENEKEKKYEIVSVLHVKQQPQAQLRHRIHIFDQDMSFLYYFL